MEKLNKDELFSLAIEMDLPVLLNFCKSSKRINDKICKNNDIWNYKIRKDFPDDQFTKIFHFLSPKDSYMILYQLRKRGFGPVQRERADLLTTAFDRPSFIEEPLRQFILNANFGNIPGTNIPIRLLFQEIVGKYGIISRAVMTPLLTIYEFVNGLRFEQDGKKYFRAGPEMNQYLDPYLTALEATDRAKTDAQLTDHNGQVRKRFDRNQFVNRLQSIVNPGFRSNANLSPQELEYINAPQITEALSAIQFLVSVAMESVRNRNNIL